MKGSSDRGEGYGGHEGYGRRWGSEGKREPWLAPRKRPLTLYFYPSLVIYLLQSVWKQYFVRRQFSNPEHV